jgi:hypothetical protein
MLPPELCSQDLVFNLRVVINLLCSLFAVQDRLDNISGSSGLLLGDRCRIIEPLRN